MARKLQKRKLLRRKSRILRTLTSPKSVTRLSINMDALLCILYNLKLKLEKTMKEYLNLIATRRPYLLEHRKVVKVDKAGKEEFVIRVRCEKRDDDNILVAILEAFEEMGLCVMQARVSSSNCYFSMEAIAVATNDQALQVIDISQAMLKAIDI